VVKNRKHSFKEMLKSRGGRYLALFLISAWMFVLGVLVGRGTAPVRFDLNRLDTELAELKAKEQQQQMARVKIDPKAGEPRADMEFYEELKKTPKHPELSARRPPAKPKPEPKKTAPEAAKKPPEKPAVKKAVKPSKTAAGASAQSTSVSLTVQAASLKDPQDADDLVSRLKKKGYPAYKTIAVVPQQGIWFRVRVGRFDNREEADGTLQRLKKDGFDPFLVNWEK
jgi:cell division septation protein DedD